MLLIMKDKTGIDKAVKEIHAKYGKEIVKYHHVITGADEFVNVVFK